jgi:YD repeat-containing protein
MNKDTKKLLVLVGLLVVLGGFAAWRLGVFGGDDPPPKKAADPAQPAQPAQPAGPTQPAGPNQPAAGPAAQPGQAAPEQDLEIPPELTPPPVRSEWPVRKGGAGDAPDPNRRVFDPLKVQNIDVVDPDRRKYIEDLKAEWVLDGITVTRQEVLKIDATGKPMIGESVMEPKPMTEMVIQRDEFTQIVYDPETGKARLVEQIVYETEIVNGVERVVMTEELDDDGNVVLDEFRRPVMVPKPKYEQAVDENGNLLWDEQGNPQWVMRVKYDSQGRRVVKQVPLILRRQVIKDGKPVQDEDGNPVYEMEQIYEPAVDDEGRPRFTPNGEPIYVMIPEVDEDGNEVLGPDGRPVMVPKPRMVPDTTPQTEIKNVVEAWFKGKDRPFREKDRLTNTRFTIDRIFTERVYRTEGLGGVRVRSGVDLLGDTGARITIFLADDSRYD